MRSSFSHTQVATIRCIIPHMRSISLAVFPLSPSRSTYIHTFAENISSSSTCSDFTLSGADDGVGLRRLLPFGGDSLDVNPAREVNRAVVAVTVLFVRLAYAPAVERLKVCDGYWIVRIVPG